MYVGGRYCCSFVAIEKRMVLNQAFEQSCRLGNPILVVAGLGSEHGCFQGTEISNTVRAAELIDEDGVKS
jgi:hypothetical protein